MRHLYDKQKMGGVLKQLMAVFEDDDGLGDDPKASKTAVAYEKLRLPTALQLQEEFQLTNSIPLLPQQQSAFDMITKADGGLFLLTGGPGSGKSFLTKKLAFHFRDQDKVVLLCGSTGAAAVRLSKYAGTVHSTFTIPIRGPVPHIHAASKIRPVLEKAEVLFIDEMSMLTADVIDNIMTQLRRIHRVPTNEEVLKKVTIIFVGDHAQLPPVCKHHLGDDGNLLCKDCHIAHSPWWSRMTKVELECNPRFSGDPAFATFMNIIRKKKPTRNEFQTMFLNKVNKISKEEARRMVSSTGATALCSHRQVILLPSSLNPYSQTQETITST